MKKTILIIMISLSFLFANKANNIVLKHIDNITILNNFLKSNDKNIKNSHILQKNNLNKIKKNKGDYYFKLLSDIENKVINLILIYSPYENNYKNNKKNKDERIKTENEILNEVNNLSFLDKVLKKLFKI